jgi:Holliday junction DNA helicase RuvA
MYAIINMGDKMFEYIIGKITYIYPEYIVLESNNIGYKIYTSNPYSYRLDTLEKIFVYEHIREDEDTLYGFKTIEEKTMFLKLIEVKGLGPKMALPLLSVSSDDLMNEIENGNINYLKKFPKIGDKVARQIILDLKGKLVSKEEVKVSDNELKDALLGLGYKTPEINKILPNIDSSLKIEDRIKEALKLLLK